VYKPSHSSRSIKIRTKENIVAEYRKENRGSVVITGASTGIGQSCAFYLDNIGFRVFAGVRKVSDRDMLKRESSGRIIPLLLDVTNAASIVSAAEAVAVTVGEAGLNGLVNNAGIVVAGPLEFLPLDEIRKQFEVNVLGQIAVIQAFLPLLRRARGRIVNMGSISGRVAAPFLGPYAASKFALEAFTDSLRVELLPWDIKISIIEPGDVATPIWGKSIEAAEKVAKNYPPEAFSLYAQAFAAIQEEAQREANTGISPNVIARLVAHALTARKPRTRYLTGKGVRLRLFLKKILPDRVFDRLVVLHLGLPRVANL
jgi:NAD(P)-dependent dehydrogenase (short-subunit alcohol dehydrogenase family)